ncbi:hypothetical protein ACLBUU_33740, partial [Pseudomonas aeruginosa]
MYIMLNYVNRLLDPCSFALRSRFHAWFEAFSRVPHLDGLLPRLNPGQIWQHPHKTSAMANLKTLAEVSVEEMPRFT